MTGQATPALLIDAIAIICVCVCACVCAAGRFHSTGRGLVSRQQAVATGSDTDHGTTETLLHGRETVSRRIPQ